MKNIYIKLLAALLTVGSVPVALMAQEVDDMYFSASDRQKVKYERDLSSASNTATQPSENYYREDYSSDKGTEGSQRTKNPDYSRYTQAAQGNASAADQNPASSNTQYYDENYSSGDYKNSPYLDPSYQSATVVNNYYGGSPYNASPAFGYNSFYRPMAYSSGWNSSVGFSSGWGSWGNNWSFGVGYNSGFYGNRFGGYYDPFYAGYGASPFYGGGYGFNNFSGGFGYGACYPYAYYNPYYGGFGYAQGYSNGYYDAVGSGYSNNVQRQVYNGPRQQRGGQVINGIGRDASSRGRYGEGNKTQGPERQAGVPSRSSVGPDYNNSRQENAQRRYSTGRTNQEYGRQTLDAGTPSRQTDHATERPDYNNNTPRLDASPAPPADNFDQVPGQNTQPRMNPARPRYNNQLVPGTVTPENKREIRRQSAPSRQPSIQRTAPSGGGMDRPAPSGGSSPSRNSRGR